MVALIENGYILAIGEGFPGVQITDEEVSAIMNAIKIKPPATEDADFRLREDLIWEEFPIDPPDPDPEINESELLDILMGGAE